MPSQTDSPNTPMSAFEIVTAARYSIIGVAQLVKVSCNSMERLVNTLPADDWPIACREIADNIRHELSKLPVVKDIEPFSHANHSHRTVESRADFDNFVKSFEGRFQFSAKTFASKSDKSCTMIDAENYDPQLAKFNTVNSRQAGKKSAIRSPLLDITSNHHDTTIDYCTLDQCKKSTDTHNIDTAGHSRLTFDRVFTRKTTGIDKKPVPSLDLTPLVKHDSCRQLACRDYWSLIFNNKRDCQHCIA